MMNRTLIFIFSLSIFLLLAPAARAGGVEGGEAAYNRRCAGCHGTGGVGTDKGPPLVHRIYRPDHHADISFRLAIARGVRAHHWRFGDMPGIRGVGPEEAEMIIGYVRGLQKAAGIF